MVTFTQVFDRVIGHEGGYVNDPKDPGGETKWGISKRSYPHLDIANLSREGAKTIYFEDFWQPVAMTCPDGSVRFQLFDAAFNHGFSNATRFLQRAVGTADDGHWGKLSVQAYHAMSENDILLRFLAHRVRFFTKLSTFSRFGKGWMNRIASNLLYAAEDNRDA